MNANDFIVTGISRSGTSMFTVMLDQLPNTVCLNEVLPKTVERLPEAFRVTRQRLLAGKRVWNKFSGDALATDTFDPGVQREKRRPGKILDEGLCLGSKRNLPYLNQLSALVGLGYPIVAMVRDPVFTIASWRTTRAQEKRIPAALADQT